MSCRGKASTHFVSLSTNIIKYLLPDDVSGKGPAKSTCQSSSPVFTGIGVRGYLATGFWDYYPPFISIFEYEDSTLVDCEFSSHTPVFRIKFVIPEPRVECSLIQGSSEFLEGIIFCLSICNLAVLVEFYFAAESRQTIGHCV
ncbi:hypothetical protein RF11_15222 [Thelohanellus kitauei]|uniref:Uncharacterized protein n=1 Tax=Thelohanellus kitauei TaxID=669202 RepID=A0A0C2NFC8_THEKT|nr:hypothetical protein RF11_15222 [Thelohanellus kitauei]